MAKGLIKKMVDEFDINLRDENVIVAFNDGVIVFSRDGVEIKVEILSVDRVVSASGSVLDYLEGVEAD